METGWRPIHHRLKTQPPEGHIVHLMLVTDDDPQKHQTACGKGLGEWISGDSRQITCKECLETVHA